MQNFENVHGLFGNPSWEPPTLVKLVNQSARPGYDTEKAHEYEDSLEVKREKARVLVTMLKNSKLPLIYSGAGVSTSSGIADYATQSEQEAKTSVRSPMDAKPSYAHNALTALYKKGLIKHWIQQNHDGLPQKAGFPQHALNEIHGSWYDPSNPVIPMSGNLRDDCFQWMLEWENTCDTCIALGTSLAGMNADRVAKSCSERAVGASEAKGLIIVSIQKTTHDDISQLRVFSRIDEFMELVMEELDITVHSNIYTPSIPKELEPDTDVYMIPFDENGVAIGERRALDLRDNSLVKITSGPFKGDVGIVTGKNLEGHYKIRFKHVMSQRTKLRAPMTRTFGLWWVEEAVNGRGLTPGGGFPVVSVPRDISLEYSLE